MAENAGILLAPEVDSHQQDLHRMQQELTTKLRNVQDDTEAIKAAWASDASAEFQSLAMNLHNECEDAIKRMQTIVSTADDQIEKLKGGAASLG